MSGGQKTISIDRELQFESGKSIKLSRKGQIFIIRPVAGPVTVRDPRYAVRFWDYNVFRLKLGYDSGIGAMNYDVRITYEVPAQLVNTLKGLGDLTQVLNTYDVPGRSTKRGVVDGPEFYELSHGVLIPSNSGSYNENSNWLQTFTDGPSTLGNPVGTYLTIDCTDYIRFTPQSSGDNIWVTLGILNWNAKANANSPSPKKVDTGSWV